MGASLDFDAVMHRALEAAAQQTKCDAAMIVLEQGDNVPIVETYGLSNAESSQQLIGLPPDVSQARAITIRYRYTEEEMANDEFRLMGGIAVPLFDGKPTRTGTLAVFWRRTEREPGVDEVDLLEELVASFGPPIENARRYEEARRLADMDPVTGLQNERYFDERLVARCHGRVGTSGSWRSSSFGSTSQTEERRSSRRSAAAFSPRCEARTSPAISERGCFAIILPEVGLTEAEHLHTEAPVRPRAADRRRWLEARPRLRAPRASARGQCGDVHAPRPGNVPPEPIRSRRGASSTQAGTRPRYSSSPAASASSRARQQAFTASKPDM